MHHNGNVDIPLPWKMGGRQKILIEETVTLKECGDDGVVVRFFKDIAGSEAEQKEKRTERERDA